MSYVKMLYEKLNEMGMRLGGVTLGDNPGDAETVAKELYYAMIEIQEGRAEPAFCYDSPELIGATGMSEAEQEADPEKFKRLYAEAAKQRGVDYDL